MPTIILDTDFLSSFLKISSCDLVRLLYQVDQAIIPAAVHRELAQTTLLSLLLAIPWITVMTEVPSIDEMLAQDSTFQALGSGEQECILLARVLPDVVLLVSDNKARQFARSQGIAVANIPAFLLACKAAGLVTSTQMIQIIDDLKTQDFYEFRPAIRRALLE
jgi:predicted nucleic acid-binding protein